MATRMNCQASFSVATVDSLTPMLSQCSAALHDDKAMPVSAVFSS